MRQGLMADSGVGICGERILDSAAPGSSLRYKIRGSGKRGGRHAIDPVLKLGEDGQPHAKRHKTRS